MRPLRTRPAGGKLCRGLREFWRLFRRPGRRGLVLIHGCVLDLAVLLLIHVLLVRNLLFDNSFFGRDTGQNSHPLPGRPPIPASRNSTPLETDAEPKASLFWEMARIRILVPVLARNPMGVLASYSGRD